MLQRGSRCAWSSRGEEGALHWVSWGKTPALAVVVVGPLDTRLDSAKSRAAWLNSGSGSAATARHGLGLLKLGPGPPQSGRTGRKKRHSHTTTRLCTLARHASIASLTPGSLTPGSLTPGSSTPGPRTRESLALRPPRACTRPTSALQHGRRHPSRHSHGDGWRHGQPIRPRRHHRLWRVCSGLQSDHVRVSSTA
jgi:hypothetical protein